MNNYMAAKKETSPFTLVPLPPRKPDSRAHPAEVSQLQHDEEDSLVSGDLCRPRLTDQWRPLRCRTLANGDPCKPKLIGLWRPCSAKLFGRWRPLTDQDLLANGDPMQTKTLANGDPCDARLTGQWRPR